MLDIQTLSFDPLKGCDTAQTIGNIDFDPSKYNDADAACSAFFLALKMFAAKHGYAPSSVVMNPSYAKHTRCVCWEEGPYQWGVFIVGTLHSANWFTEPYHSFDVCFEKK